LPANRGTLRGCGRKPEVDFDTSTSTLVHIRVSPGGSVTSASVAASSGDSELDRLALQWVRTCRFTSSPNGRVGQISVVWQN
jgi:TonB family protein